MNYGRNKIKTEVEGLKKKGVHLYGIAPIPFLVWMLRGMAKDVSVPHATSVIESVGKSIAGVTGAVAGKTVVGATEAPAEKTIAGASDITTEKVTTETIGSVASQTAKECTKKTAKKVVAARVAACALGVAAATGVGLTAPKIIQNMQQNKDDKVAETFDDTPEKTQEVQKNQFDAFANLRVNFSGISPKVEIRRL